MSGDFSEETDNNEGRFGIRALSKIRGIFSVPRKPQVSTVLEPSVLSSPPATIEKIEILPSPREVELDTLETPALVKEVGRIISSDQAREVTDRAGLDRHHQELREVYQAVLQGEDLATGLELLEHFSQDILADLRKFNRGAVIPTDTLALFHTDLARLQQAIHLIRDREHILPPIYHPVQTKKLEERPTVTTDYEPPEGLEGSLAWMEVYDPEGHQKFMAARNGVEKIRTFIYSYNQSANPHQWEITPSSEIKDKPPLSRPFRFLEYRDTLPTPVRSWESNTGISIQVGQRELEYLPAGDKYIIALDRLRLDGGEEVLIGVLVPSNPKVLQETLKDVLVSNGMNGEELANNVISRTEECFFTGLKLYVDNIFAKKLTNPKSIWTICTASKGRTEDRVYFTDVGKIGVGEANLRTFVVIAGCRKNTQRKLFDRITTEHYL